MAKMHPMVDMELDDEEQMDLAVPGMPEQPRYPYGLRICLTEKEFAKLDLDPKEAFVGGIIHLHGLARVTSVSSTDTKDGECCRVELQIEDLCIEGEDLENDEYE